MNSSTPTRIAAALLLTLSLTACAGSLPGTATALPEEDEVEAQSAPEIAAAPSAPLAPVAAAPAPAQQAAALPAQPAAPKKPAAWGALFIAGDNSIKVFDNATRRFFSILERKDDVNVRRLTSDPATAPSPEDVADVGPIDAALGYITPSQQEKCLVFMTSHGREDGFYLAQAGGSGGVLPPSVLDQWLDNHCGVRPTVVIVSSSYSGLFLEQGMAQPNRIILTAAKAGLPSFDHAAGGVYTHFDKCLLDSWTWAYSWAELYDRTKACVTERETELQAKPSEPQAFFGADVAGLDMP
ncbi:C13 family peptidase [Dongia mobilis]|uniref:C13 family peptidase n=1 Tax=Dongia sp. TaxID=1977262 RepID=UPI0026EBE792